MEKKTVLTLLAGVLIGLVLGPKLSALPVLDRLPKV